METKTSSLWILFWVLTKGVSSVVFFSLHQAGTCCSLYRVHVSAISGQGGLQGWLSELRSSFLKYGFQHWLTALTLIIVALMQLETGSRHWTDCQLFLKGKVVYIHNGLLLLHKKAKGVWEKMSTVGNNHIKWLISEIQNITCFL